MSIVSAIAQLLSAGGDYQISRSVRLRSSASAYLTRTPATASGQNQWTYSCWVKRSLGSTQYIIGGNTLTSGTARNITSVEFASDALAIFAFNNSSGYYFNRVSAAVFRDPSAWYHLVIQFDPDNATSADKFIAYVNGVRLTWATSADSGVAGNTSSTAYRAINNTYRNDINGGYQGGGAPVYFGDGYQTECIMVSGSIVAPTAFGEFDAVTGVWKPKKYAGTYGTNGFYLNFSDNSAATAATIGKDYSGNGNNWTPNNISVTAGTTYDSMIDVPTPYADGGNGRGNYAALNPLATYSAGNSFTLSNGNLFFTQPTCTNGTAVGSTIALKNGDGLFYYEITQVSRTTVGGDATQPFTLIVKDFASTGASYSSWQYYLAGSGSSADPTGAALTGVGSVSNGDVIMVALDLVNGKLFLGKNGTWWNSGNPAAGTGAVATNLANYPVFIPGVGNGGGNMSNFSVAMNFGQQPFAYTKPTGFKALNTQNLPDATIKQGKKYFDANVWTGNSSTQSIVNAGAFAPDFVWIKDRTTANDHRLLDTSRGATKFLSSSLTNAEATDSTGLTAFNSNGFSLGSDSSYNFSGRGYVGWQWKKGATPGFDIVTYTGDGSAGRTIAHSLGVAPKMMIVKRRNAIENWGVYHASLPSAAYYLLLNTTAVQDSAGGTIWNSTAPSSSVFTVGTSTYSNANGSTYVNYLFAEVAGFSKFGSYTGNGSADGPFVYCGFRPKFILIKSTATLNSWHMVDTSRSTINLATEAVWANESSVESTSTTQGIDILSNGFKIRNSTSEMNNSGTSLIFAAFAENPFKNSLAR